jgi:pyruvate dehydrogenase E1 component beta subunit
MLSELSEARPNTVKLFYREAIARALREEMLGDARVILIGQDVAAMGGSYKEFAGLFEEFGPRRVRNMPVAEACMIGLGVGAAAAGMRPLVSVTYMDFLMLGLDPLVNYAAKLRYKTGGQLSSPVVVKATAGAKGQGVAHSQCIESWLMSVPGLKIVAPSTAGDAYGLLKSALRDDGPVLFVDHKRLFPGAGEVTLAEDAIPIGQAIIRRRGSDITVVAHSYMVRVAEIAADHLAAGGISCEVVDLRSLAPLDLAAICESVARTRSLLTLEEGQITCGVGSEIAFRVKEELGPVRVARLGALPAPVSSNPVLEALCIPDAERVSASVRQLLSSPRNPTRNEPS